MKFLPDLKALGLTIMFVIGMTTIMDYFNWELDFLIGWWSCMVWYAAIKYYKSRV